MKPLYVTYTAVTQHQGKQYFLEDVTMVNRTWTTNDEKSMQFSTRKEVDIMIKMFAIKGAFVGVIPHYA